MASVPWSMRLRDDHSGSNTRIAEELRAWSARRRLSSGLAHLAHVLGREHSGKQRPVALATDAEAITRRFGDLEA